MQLGIGYHLSYIFRVAVLLIENSQRVGLGAARANYARNYCHHLSILHAIGRQLRKNGRLSEGASERGRKKESEERQQQQQPRNWRRPNREGRGPS